MFVCEKRSTMRCGNDRMPNMDHMPKMVVGCQIWQRHFSRGALLSAPTPHTHTHALHTNSFTQTKRYHMPTHNAVSHAHKQCGITCPQTIRYHMPTSNAVPHAHKQYGIICPNHAVSHAQTMRCLRAHTSQPSLDEVVSLGSRKSQSSERLRSLRL